MRGGLPHPASRRGPTLGGHRALGVPLARPRHQERLGGSPGGVPPHPVLLVASKLPNWSFFFCLFFSQVFGGFFWSPRLVSFWNLGWGFFCCFLSFWGVLLFFWLFFYYFKQGPAEHWVFY